jgi:AAA family ATP:ADP antiporter
LADALHRVGAVDYGYASEAAEHGTVGRWLRKVFPVRRSEAVTVALLAINCFILLTCYYVLKVAREPLILLGGGAELKAYASAGQTILLLGVVPAFSWLSNRTTRIRLMTTMQVIFIGCLVAFYVLAQAQAPIGLAFYLWLGIFNVLCVSNFWSYANDVFTEDAGKRVFAVIGLGASIGAIVGAFVPHILHHYLGIHGLMLFAVIGLGISIVLYRIVEKREGEHAKEVRAQKAAKPAGAGDKKGGFHLVVHDRYLRTLAVMLLVATVINTCGEYVIGKMATDNAAHLAKAARDAYISRFYSDYYGVVNLISALLQGLVVARLLTTLGIRKSLFIMPVIVLGGWLACVFYVNLLMIRIEKTSENSLDYSLNNTVRQALFLPTSPAAKYKAKAAIDTFFFRMGDVIAGIGIVFLFVEVLGLGVKAFAALNVALAGIWILLAYRAGRLHDELVSKNAQPEQG